jgi:hypothetical protein
MTEGPEHNEQPVTAEEIEAEARRLYGEDRYEMLYDEHVKEAYRKQAARSLRYARQHGPYGGE